MALTASQKRQLARRTTDTSRARLMATFTGAPAAPPAPRPTAIAAPVAPARTAAQFTPDAQYIAEAAQQQFNRTNSVNQLNAQSESERSNLAEAIRRLTEDAVGQRQGVREGANKQGLFYSGQLGKRLGDLESQIARQRADLQSDFDQSEAAREAARQAILQGAPLEEAALRAAGVERQIGRDEVAAGSNQLAPNPVKKKKKKKR